MGADVFPKVAARSPSGYDNARASTFLRSPQPTGEAQNRSPVGARSPPGKAYAYACLRLGLHTRTPAYAYACLRLGVEVGRQRAWACLRPGVSVGRRRRS